MMVGNNEVLTHQPGFDNTGALVASNRRWQLEPGCAGAETWR